MLGGILDTNPRMQKCHARPLLTLQAWVSYYLRVYYYYSFVRYGDHRVTFINGGIAERPSR